ncbi:MAG TPA: acyl-CoA dehydratase activase [Candidatus Brocadiia bacterium]|nr:acyl-CoA dehydratase activase [Candidatus Brocadiia bacterium]
MTIASIGLDAGSTTVKAVAINPEGQIAARVIENTKPDISSQAERLIEGLRSETGSGPDTTVSATGYGRKMVRNAGKVITEITAHGRGAFFLAGKALTLVDVGGQDSKVIRIAASGNVEDFAMNDKCAAGTGRFLEVILHRLEIGYDQVEPMLDRASGSVSISNTCTVFAESEIISLLARGVPVEEIVYAVHAAFAERVGSLVMRLGRPSAIHMSGGGARNAGLVKLLGKHLCVPATVLPEAQFVGALGAALTAASTRAGI